MKQYRLLELCAKVEGCAQQYEMICKECEGFAEWDELLAQAEKEGMSPLLKKHLEASGASYPVSVKRSLALLALRHQKKAQVRERLLIEVLELCYANQLSPILIKGAALCYTLYPSPALRPMRDIDILFHPKEVDTAQDIMRKAGFSQYDEPIPADHFHLPPLGKTVDGVEVCFELHRGLYPNCPPYYPEVDVDSLLENGKKIAIGGDGEDGRAVEAVVFNNEEMLHYIYQHAFHTPLTYEPYKLINAADIIGFTEKYFLEIDWKKVYAISPLLERGLPLLHYISPWNFTAIGEDFFPAKKRNRTIQPEVYSGWPKRRRKEFLSEGSSFWQIFRATCIPPFWWAGIYYNVDSFLGYLGVILYKHPRQVLWWVRFYSRLNAGK